MSFCLSPFQVAITIFWLGRSVSSSFEGPTLDASAFSALVHSHGTKNIISDDCFKHGNPVRKESVTGVESSMNVNKHIRDSSYDSLGSYDRESESSYDELDHSGSMPVRSDKGDMRRYPSTGSLSMPRDMKLSTVSNDSVYSDDKMDMYRSSPDLSQGSLAHTRSSSTDSAEGGYYGNHSRQSSGSIDYPTRRLSTSGRKTSTATPDPLQFVKTAGAQSLAQTAKKQMEVAREVNLMRGKVDVSAGEEQDWQSVCMM